MPAWTCCAAGGEPPEWFRGDRLKSGRPESREPFGDMPPDRAPRSDDPMEDVDRVGYDADTARAVLPVAAALALFYLGLAALHHLVLDPETGHHAHHRRCDDPPGDHAGPHRDRELHARHRRCRRRPRPLALVRRLRPAGLDGLDRRCRRGRRYRAHVGRVGCLPGHGIGTGVRRGRAATSQHRRGRRILAAARAIEETCRVSDVVARWGGDEFVVVGLGPSEPAHALDGRVRAFLDTDYPSERSAVDACSSRTASPPSRSDAPADHLGPRRDR